MSRRSRFILAALLVGSMGLGVAGCAATLKAFDADESGQSDVTRAGQTVSSIGEATGNPWLLLAGQVITFAGAVYVAVSRAKKHADGPLTPDQIKQTKGA